MIKKSTNLIGIITDTTPLNEAAQFRHMIPKMKKRKYSTK